MRMIVYECKDKYRTRERFILLVSILLPMQTSQKQNDYGFYIVGSAMSSFQNIYNNLTKFLNG